MWLMLQPEIERVEAIRARALPTVVRLADVKHALREMEMAKGGIAKIQIKGPLLNEPDAYLDYYGYEYTVYSDIVKQTAEAVGRKANRIDYLIDSPGGYVEGLDEAMDAIANSPVKTQAVASGYITSAAYMLGSQAGSIVAEGDLTMVGSIGVATYGIVSSTIKHVANTASQKKRPDLATDEGVKVVREELDDIYMIIAEKIAAGRKTTVDKVVTGYGEGAVMSARTALQKGMIDKIEKAESTPAATTAEKIGGSRMDLHQLKSEHPEVYREAVAEGTKLERDRVETHLLAATDGEGDVAVAHKAILAGEEYSSRHAVQHDNFRRKKTQIAAREEEAPGDLDHMPTSDDDANKEAKLKAEYEAAHPGVEVW